MQAIKKRNRKKAKSDERIIGTFDFETDPFETGVIPSPFVCGIYSPIHGYHYIWGDNCASAFIRFIETIEEPHCWYAHNGGKFDFFFILAYVSGKARIINSRIVEIQVGRHILRDSFAAIPAPLGAIDKGDIDYSKMHADNRDANREEILVYLERDCVSLYKLCQSFVERFGFKLTIGGAAISELKKRHDFREQDESHDERFRPFFFGGRVQCFEGGILNGKFKVFDINSAYPFTMRNYTHPTGRLYSAPANPKILDNGDMHGYGSRFYFAIVEGYNRGAFPLREKEGLNWASEYGIYYVTSHEMRAALKCGLFDIVKIHAAEVCHEEISFGQFVDDFMRDKIDAENAGDIIGRLFAKLIMNNAYGKFAMNPREFKDYEIVDNVPEAESRGGRITEIHGDKAIAEWDADSKRYIDVATAASITGATRAYLMESLHAAKRPIYCDTDSIICEELALDLHATRLGAWKTEAEGDTLAIGGKKLYALFASGKCIKKASKGVRLTGEEIFRVAGGTVVDYANPVPTFSLKNFGKFTTRRVRSRI